MKKICFAIMSLILIISVCSYSQELTDSPVAQKFTSLKEGSFFDTDDTVLRAFESDLLDNDFNGLLLSAPKSVDTAKKDSLPLLVAIGYSGDRAWDYPIQKHCYLIAVNKSEGSVYIEPLFQDKKAKSITNEGKKGEKPTGLALCASVVMRVNIRDIMELPWEKGEWCFTILYHDWLSNKVNVFLTGRNSK